MNEPHPTTLQQDARTIDERRIDELFEDRWPLDKPLENYECRFDAVKDLLDAHDAEKAARWQDIDVHPYRGEFNKEPYPARVKPGPSLAKDVEQRLLATAKYGSEADMENLGAYIFRNRVAILNALRAAEQGEVK